MNFVSIESDTPGPASAAAVGHAARRHGRFPNWLVVSAMLLAASVLTEMANAASPAPASAAMRLVEQYPHAHQLMSGSGVAFALGFDRPLDHAASRFTLVAPDGHERTIRLRLNAQPNTLYASVGRLDAGDYELRWQARAADGHTLSGAFPFTVSTVGRPGAEPSSWERGDPVRATRGT